MKLFALIALTTMVVGCCDDPGLGATKTETEPQTVIGPLWLDLDKWVPDDDAVWPMRLKQNAPTHPINQSDHVIYEIVLPIGSRLISVHTCIDPNEGHSQIPDTRAGSMLWIRNGGSDEKELIGHATTPDDSVSSYEERHMMIIEPYRELVVKPDVRVFFHVIGEYGKNFVSGLVVDTPKITFEPPAL